MLVRNDQFYRFSAAFLFRIFNILDASRASSTTATCLDFSKRILNPQYGQVLVFCSALAANKPPHLLQTTITKETKFFTLSENLFHALVNNASARGE
jgi:hypothetical protein